MGLFNDRKNNFSSSCSRNNFIDLHFFYFSHDSAGQECSLFSSFLPLSKSSRVWKCLYKVKGSAKPFQHHGECFCFSSTTGICTSDCAGNKKEILRCKLVATKKLTNGQNLSFKIRQCFIHVHDCHDVFFFSSLRWNYLFLAIFKYLNHNSYMSLGWYNVSTVKFSLVH